MPTGTATQPTDFNYWKREALAYQSGLLDDLAPGLVAARCYGVGEQPDETVWLWLEDIKGEPGATWPLSRYALAARHLGRSQGPYLTDRALPDKPWLSRNWLRQWRAHRLVSVRNEANIALLSNHDTWQHPLVRRAYPVPVGEQILTLLHESISLVDAVEHLPQVLCHLDFYSRNLLSRRTPGGDEQTVALDWAFAGIGGIGEDAGQLTATSAGFGDVPPEQFPELDRHVFAGYLAGLREAGWQGDWRLARLGYCAHAAARWLPHAIMPIAVALDESKHVRWEEFYRRPIGDAVEHMGHFIRFMISLAGEARRLQNSLIVEPAEV